MKLALSIWLALGCLASQGSLAQTAQTETGSLAERTDSANAERTDNSVRKNQTDNDQTSTSTTAASDELPVKYIGNCFSFKFHRPSCPFVRVMNGAKAVLFHFRKNAIDQGYQPCRYCLPPFWKSVSAKVLKSSPAEDSERLEKGSEPAPVEK